MVKDGYRSLRIPEGMVSEIEDILQREKDLGYASISEFVKDAIRRRLEEIKRHKK